MGIRSAPRGPTTLKLRCEVPWEIDHWDARIDFGLRFTTSFGKNSSAHEDCANALSIFSREQLFVDSD